MKSIMSNHGKSKSGFTLIEILVTVVIMGILGGVVIRFTGNEWRRERINTVAIELAGWLEEIRSNSLRETNSSTTSGGCEVTFTPIIASNASTPLASVTSVPSVNPTGCASNPIFRVTGLTGNDTYSSASSNGTKIIFTPRGTTMNSQPIELRFKIDGNTYLRCVRVSGNLGLIRIGRNDNATGAPASSSCSDYSRF